jgi:hypothetical protein
VSYAFLKGVLLLTFIGSVLLNVLYCWKVNKDKAEGKYDKYTGYGDDRDPSFKMIL